MKSEYRILVLTDLVDSTKLVSTVGDHRAAELNAAVDRVTRDLLAARGGQEIDKTDGFLLLFTHSADAVAFAIELHDALAVLSEAEGVTLAMRVGIHGGQVGLRENAADDVARGAKPVEVEGLAKPLAARVMGLAGAHQTLCTSTIGREVYHSDAEQLTWMEHGRWRFKGVENAMLLTEVGRPGVAPLRAPVEVEKAWRALSGPLAGQREGLRRALANRAVRLLLIAGSASALAGVGLYVDHTRLKVREFAEMRWTPEGPVGWGSPLAGTDRVRVTTRAGLVLEVEEVTSAGAPLAETYDERNHFFHERVFGLTHLLEGSPDSFLAWEFFNPRHKDFTHRNLVRSEAGDLIGMEMMQVTGRTLVKAIVEPMDTGLRLRWQTPYGVPTVGPSGAAVEELQFDDRGRLILREYLNATGLNPQPRLDGAVRETREWDDQSRLIRVAGIRADGSPAQHMSGVSAREYVYNGGAEHPQTERLIDPTGQPIASFGPCPVRTWSDDRTRWTCVDRDLAPRLAWATNMEALLCHRAEFEDTDQGRLIHCIDTEGATVGAIRQQFYPSGHLQRMELTDPSGKAILGRSGWSSVELFVDASGRLFGSPRYRDRTGAPSFKRTTSLGGLSRQIHRPFSTSYDDNGRLATITIVDHDGKPTRGERSWDQARIGYDRAGRVSTAELFDVHGQPAESTSGAHRQVHAMNDRGLPDAFHYEDLSGAPATDGYGTHRIAFTWDAQGRNTSVAFFDAEGPMIRFGEFQQGDGAHLIRRSYDDTNDSFMESREAFDGAPALGSAPQKTAGRYDGHEQHTSWFDESGAPQTVYGDIHTWVRALVAQTVHGEMLVDGATFGLNGESVPDDLGCHQWKNQMDSKGQRIAYQCLGEGGLAKNINEASFSGYTYEHDALGRVVREVARDEDGARTELNGVSETVKSYDDRDNVTKEVFLGADGRAVGAAQTRFHIVESTYDRNNRQVSAVVRDVEDNILERRHVLLARDDRGRPVEWRWFEPNGGLAQTLTLERNDHGVSRMGFANDDGGPTDGGTGWATAEFTWDGDDSVTAMYTDADGKPAHLGGRTNSVGDGRVARVNDHDNANAYDLGQLIATEYGESREHLGWSGWTLTLDNMDYGRRRTYLDSLGNPTVPDNPGYASIEWTRIGWSVVRTRIFDTSGEPMEICGAVGTELRNRKWIAVDRQDNEVAVDPLCLNRRAELQQSPLVRGQL